MWRKYEEFIDELAAKFPHEREGIKKFYDECWRIFDRCVRGCAHVEMTARF